MIEVALRKRKAKYIGEIGFFPDDQISDEDCKGFGLDTEVLAQLKSEKNLEALKYLWALVTIVANNTEGQFLDKDDAMEKLKLRARFAKLMLNERNNKWELVPKSLKRLNGDQMLRLINRIKHIVLTEILPGVKDRELEKEIQEMLE